MSITDEDVLTIIRTKPQARAVQVADLLDVELDVAEAKLAAMVRSQRLITEKVKAPNNLEVDAYSINPLFLGWQPPAAGASVGAAGAELPGQAQTVEQDDQTELQPDSSAPGRAEKGPTKVQLALNHLAAHGATDAMTLRRVMGIPLTASVRNYLRTQIESGRVIAIDDVFTLKAERSTDGASDDTPAAGARPIVLVDQVEPPPLIDPRAIELLRTSLPSDEYRGYLRASAIRHTLFPASADSATDYQIAGIYISLLADHVVQEALA